MSGYTAFFDPTTSGVFMITLYVRHLACLAIFCIVSGCGTDTSSQTEENENASSVQTPLAEASGTETADNMATETIEDVQEGMASEAVAAPGIGEETFKKTCALCHGNPGMGAPVLGNREDWAPRIAKGKDVLYQHALEGYVGETSVMPPRGANPNLDDDTIKATVDYMVAQSQ